MHQKGQHPPAIPVKRQGLGVEVRGNIVHDPAFAHLVKIAVLVLILHLPVGVQRDLRHALPDHVKHIVHIGIIGGHAGAVVRVGGRADAVNVSAQRFRDDLRDAVLTVLPQFHRVDGNMIKWQVVFRVQRSNARKNTAFPPVCKKCAKVCRAPEKGKSHEESCDSSWDFGALEGTRIPGPLIKSRKISAELRVLLF